MKTALVLAGICAVVAVASALFGDGNHYAEVIAFNTGTGAVILTVVAIIFRIADRSDR